jgi:hypothetical protein
MLLEPADEKPKALTPSLLSKLVADHLCFNKIWLQAIPAAVVIG